MPREQQDSHTEQELTDDEAIAAVRNLGGDVVKEGPSWFYVAVQLSDIPEGFRPVEIGVKVGTWITAGDAARAFVGRRQWQQRKEQPV
jgi:hypothetical protein